MPRRAAPRPNVPTLRHAKGPRHVRTPRATDGTCPRTDGTYPRTDGTCPRTDGTCPRTDGTCPRRAQASIDRTVLLTTHFLDEAENLADNIAIMAEGRLR